MIVAYQPTNQPANLPTYLPTYLPTRHRLRIRHLGITPATLRYGETGACYYSACWRVRLGRTRGEEVDRYHLFVDNTSRKGRLNNRATIVTPFYHNLAIFDRPRWDNHRERISVSVHPCSNDVDDDRSDCFWRFESTSYLVHSERAREKSVQWTREIFLVFHGLVCWSGLHD